MHEAVGEGLFLTVADDGEVEEARVLHGLEEKLGVRDRFSVVGDGDDTGRVHLPHLGEVLPFEPLGDGPAGKDADHAFRAGLLHDVLGDGLVVIDGVCVGHADDGSEAAPGCGHGACPDGLLPLETGLPQVGMDVNEAGRHHETFRIDHAVGACAREVLTDLLDGVALDEYVNALVPVVPGIDETAVPYEDGQLSPPESR